MVLKRAKDWLAGKDMSPPPPPPPRLQVLMVCMGNICRSPTAEAVLREKLRRAGLGAVVGVDSAGTGGYHVGERPDPRATRHAAQRGYALDGLRARQVALDDFDRFDLVLAMDEDNLRNLRKLRPATARAELGLLMAHATDPSRPRADVVPDPYYGPAGGFDHVLDLVEHACDGLVAHLRGRLR